MTCCQFYDVKGDTSQEFTEITQVSEQYIQILTTDRKNGHISQESTVAHYDTTGHARCYTHVMTTSGGSQPEQEVSTVPKHLRHRITSYDFHLAEEYTLFAHHGYTLF